MKKITKLVFAMGLLGIGVLAQTGQDEAEVRRKIVGTWKLVSEEITLEDGGKTHDFGSRGKGYLI